MVDGEPGDLAERLDRHDGLHFRLQAAVECGLLDGQPVAVGGHHLERVADDGHEHAREDGPRLVARGRAAHLAERLHERLAPQREGARRASKVDVCGKSLADQALSENSAAAGADLDRRLAGVDVDLLVRQVAHDVGEQSRRDHDVAVALDRSSRGSP